MKKSPNKASDRPVSKPPATLPRAVLQSTAQPRQEPISKKRHNKEAVATGVQHGGTEPSCFIKYGLASRRTTATKGKMYQNACPTHAREDRAKKGGQP